MFYSYQAGATKPEERSVSPELSAFVVVGVVVRRGCLRVPLFRMYISNVCVPSQHGTGKMLLGSGQSDPDGGFHFRFGSERQGLPTRTGTVVKGRIREGRQVKG